MKYVKIKISELKPDPKQPRKILEGLKELGASLKLKGQLVPIIITPDYEILDGHRRYFASKKIGIDYLDAVIHNENKLTPFLKRAYPFAINFENHDFKAWDMAEYICDIYWNYFLGEYTPKSRSDNGYSEFARYMGMSTTTVGDIIRVYDQAKKSKALDKAIKDKRISVATIREIAKTPKEEHSHYINIAENEKTEILTPRDLIVDRIRNDKAKEQLDKKDKLPPMYLNRITNKVNSIKSLLNDGVLKLATGEEEKQMKRTIKPIVIFYNKL